MPAHDPTRRTLSAAALAAHLKRSARTARRVWTEPRAEFEARRQRCRPPAVRGKRVCRFHGARAGAPKGQANGNFRHGNFANEARDVRRAVAQLRREAHALLRDIKNSSNSKGAG